MSQPSEKQADPVVASSPASRTDEPGQVLRSEDLLQGRSEVWIKHGEEMYCLRLTSAGKLYMTK